MAKSVHAKVAIVYGRNPRQCPAHGDPTNHKGDQPTYCLDCDRAVRAYGHGVWRSVKPKPHDQIVADQKAEDEEAARQQSFAERMHNRKKRAEVAKLTPEQKADALAM